MILVTYYHIGGPHKGGREVEVVEGEPVINGDESRSKSGGANYLKVLAAWRDMYAYLGSARTECRGINVGM